jgi:hypothetical protein
MSSDIMIMTKLHGSGFEVILAACDSELFGRKLDDGELTIDLGSAFFRGNEVSEEEFRGMLAQATSANIVGKDAVRIDVECECIHPDAVLEICGIPYAMFFCMG